MAHGYDLPCCLDSCVTSELTIVDASCEIGSKMDGSMKVFSIAW